MERKIIGIFVVTLLIMTMLPVAGTVNIDRTKVKNASTNFQNTDTLYPIQDSYVDINHRLKGGMWVKEYKNHGSAHSLVVVTGMAPLQAFYEPSRIFIQFDLSSIPRSEVTSATLRLYRFATGIWGPISVQGEEIHHHVYEVESSWDEDTITWSNQPDADDFVACCKIKRHYNDDGWKEWDVTSSVKGTGSHYGWMIDNDMIPAKYLNVFSFISKDAWYGWGEDRGPQLVVTYGDGPSEVVVEITQPEPLWVYLNGNRLFKITYPEEIPVAVLLNDGLVIRATASAPAGINRVEFNIGDMNGGTQNFIDYDEPYEWDWTDTPGFNVYELSAKAFDNAGQSAEDNFLMIRIM